MKKTWKIRNYSLNPGTVFRNRDLSLRKKIKNPLCFKSYLWHFDMYSLRYSASHYVLQFSRGTGRILGLTVISTSTPPPSHLFSLLSLFVPPPSLIQPCLSSHLFIWRSITLLCFSTHSLSLPPVSHPPLPRLEGFQAAFATGPLYTLQSVTCRCSPTLSQAFIDDLGGGCRNGGLGASCRDGRMARNLQKRRDRVRV